MPADRKMINSKYTFINNNYPFIVFSLSTIFMVFFSVHAVQKWPGLLAQGAITLACMMPPVMVLFKMGPDVVVNGKWPVEIKFVLLIFVLGLINICFSENQTASLKGMGLFLMSGVMVFAVSFFVFQSKQAQIVFLFLCSFCFLVLLLFGGFEFFRQLATTEERILLLSSNPIPAGSLLLLLSIGPLVSLAHADCKLKKLLWFFCLLAGIVLIFLLGKRGPILALIVMVFIGTLRYRKLAFVATLLVLIVVGIIFQFRDSLPLQYKKELFRQETVMMRLEFYKVALDVIAEKPIFGLGFNSSLSRFIPYDYKSKLFPRSGRSTFYFLSKGFQVFDNMLLSFLGEMGGLFTLTYISMFLYILRNIFLDGQTNSYINLLIIVLAGFFVHSMTFDSLKYPHLNWIFHSFLGMLARSKDFFQNENN